MAFFGFLLLVVLNMAIPVGVKVSPETGAGILWVAITFSSVLGLARTMSREKDNRCIDGLLLSPASSESIFGAKMAVNYILMLAAEITIIPLFFILYGDEFFKYFPMLALVVLLANTGFAATGTLFSAITANSSRNESLLSLLFYPVVIPLITICVRVTSMIFSGAEPSDFISWLYIIAVHGLVFSGLGYLLFGQVVMDQ
jgi:heme exporter protein B